MHGNACLTEDEFVKADLAYQIPTIQTTAGTYITYDSDMRSMDSMDSGPMT